MTNEEIKEYLNAQILLSQKELSLAKMEYSASSSLVMSFLALRKEYAHKARVEILNEVMSLLQPNPSQKKL